MKKEDFLQALGDIDESFIEEASVGLKKKKIPVYKVLSGLSAAAAVVLLILGITHFNTLFGGREKNTAQDRTENITKAADDAAYDGKSGDTKGDALPTGAIPDEAAGEDTYATEQADSFIKSDTVTEEAVTVVTDETEATDLPEQWEEMTENYSTTTTGITEAEKNETGMIPAGAAENENWEILGCPLYDDSGNGLMVVVVRGSLFKTMKDTGSSLDILDETDSSLEVLSEKDEDDYAVFQFLLSPSSEKLKYDLKDASLNSVRTGDLTVYETDLPEDAKAYINP